MSRTIKDMPWWLWHAERLGVSYPPARQPDWREVDLRFAAGDHTYREQWRTDPAVNSWKARGRSTKRDRRMLHHRYRATVRTRLRHGEYDRIGAPRETTGWEFW